MAELAEHFFFYSSRRERTPTKKNDVYFFSYLRVGRVERSLFLGKRGLTHSVVAVLLFSIAQICRHSLFPFLFFCFFLNKKEKHRLF